MWDENGNQIGRVLCIVIFSMLETDQLVIVYLKDASVLVLSDFVIPG